MGGMHFKLDSMSHMTHVTIEGFEYYESVSKESEHVCV